MKKNLCMLLALLFLFTCFAGCTKKNETDNETAAPSPSEDSNYDLIFVCPIPENEYWKLCMDGIRKADAAFGTNTRIIGPKASENFTVEIIEYMKEALAAKPDGILVYAGIEELVPLIEQATAQGIPVIALDSDAPDTSRVAYVGTDDYNLGYKAGEAMVNLTGGKAKLGIMVSSTSADREMNVVNAFLDAVGDYDIEVVARTETGINAETAALKAEEMLSEHPEITAMFNTAAYNVTGAAHAKEKLGRDDLILMGFDDTKENLQYLKNGVINAIFAQHVEQMGYQGVYLMREYLDNGSLPKSNYDLGSILVTQENIDNYSGNDWDLDNTIKNVRVGYYSGAEAFQNGFSDDARKYGYAYEYYQAIATLTGWQYEYVYGSREEILNMLLNGQVDIVAGIYKTDIRNEQVLFSNQDMGLKGEPRYFAVNQNQPELLADLNYALEQLSKYSPDFSISLWQKYYGQSTQRQILTDREREWLSKKGSLKLGYLRYNLPFSDKDQSGMPTGLVKELTALLSDFLRVEMTAVCYETLTDMEEALKNGEIDIAFPIYSDLWLNEQKGFRQTDAFISDRVMIVYKGIYSSDLMNHVALINTGLGQRYYLSNYYPDSDITYYNTKKEAFEALLKDEVQCTMGCSSIFQRFLLEHSEYKDMNIAYLETTEDFGMAVRQDNSLLAEILNKAIRQWDTATITSSMLQYSGVDIEYSFADFLKQHAILFTGILTVFLTILLFVFVSYRRKTRIFNKKQAENQEALEKALEAANEANKAKTTFLSSMSHDIRTPMNAIVGMTSIASNHMDDRERVEDCLDKIKLSSHHLLTLINDVLDISKIESGKLTLNPVVFSLRDTVTTLVNIIRPQLKAKNLQFDVHIYNMDYETIYADELRVNQIFINILTNAVKYTPEGGKVFMDLTEEYSPDSNEVKLTYIVEDTGIGMSREYMENMYEIFSRAEDSRINKIQGTGLGLAIVKQMVDMMAGSIECESEVNNGTKFTVTLTLPVAEKDKEKPMLPGLHVLLVDDDEIFLDSARDTLQDMGIIADTAVGGTAAIDMVKSEHKQGDDYSVYIIDWKMPGMDGMETIRAIRSIIGSKVSIILVSAYDWTDIEDEAIESGANGFISKPLFRSYIYERLRDVLNLTSEQDFPGDIGENDLNGKRLLIAEDNDLNWEVISELLDMYNISSDRAENGQICVDMINAAPMGTYDIILMDVQMPVMNGREATKIIRQSEKEHVRNIPIIAMTADAFAEDIAASLEAGMNGHISKPVDMDSLFQEMRKVFKNNEESF